MTASERRNAILEDLCMRRFERINNLAIICSIVVVTISILFFVYDLDRTLAIGLLVVLPFSWWIGYYIPKEENDKKIKELEKK